MNADVDTDMKTASQARTVMITAAQTQVELPVAKKIWLKPKEIVILKIISKLTGLLYFDPTQYVVLLGHLVSATGIIEVRPERTFRYTSHQRNQIHKSRAKTCLTLFIQR